VCLFEDTLPERSGARVIVAFDSSRLPPSDPLPGVGEWWWGHEGRVTGDPAECLTSESQATVVFSTEDLLPPGLKMDDVPTFLSVHPLTYAHRPLGYAVFDQPWRYGRVWTPNAIANHLSNAVYVLQQAEHLRSARRTAEEASAAKSEFVARMSHEIRTPLTAIMGYLDLCLGRITAPNERRYLMQAQASSKVLLGVLNDVLDFSKIEAQRLEIERTRFDLDQVLDQIVATCAANAFCKNVELVLDVAPGIPAGLVGDPLRLTQVLMNLVGNAIKFTARGEVVLSIELVPEAGDTTRLRFTVRDTGIGISPENLAKLTVPFVQADNSTTRRYGGTGLGLAISERLIQRMGGMLRLQSEVGRGMECSFCLQFSTDAEASRSLEEYSWPDRRVLVVDDNLASLKVITRILSEAGARVRTATTGEGAIGLMQQARQGNDPVQLLLLDEGLPGRTGCDLAQRLVDLDLLGDCRILVMAPLGELELSPMVAPEMISGIVSKPVRRGELQDRIHSVFAESEGESPPPPQPLRESDLRNVLAGRRFLLVQDDEVNRMLAKELLENAGVEVDAVESGIEAVEQVASVHYDAVLMDLDLPIMDGCEATRKIRQSTAGSILPIIAVTASVSPEDRDHCLEAGMDDYLQTPIDSDHLLGVLASWVCGPRTEPPKATGVPSVGPGPAGSLLADGTGPTHDLGSDWLDVRGSLRRLGGDRALYRRLLHRFLENHSTTGQHLQKGRRTETALRTVHTLGSAAANIGASELQKAAQALEVELRAGKPGDAAQWAKLESTLGQTLELIAIVGRNSTVPPPSSNILDPERLRRHLTALAELLDRFDAAASDFVDLLPALAGTGVVNEEVRRIQRAVRAYDFEGAGQRVQTLLSTLGQPRA
jgi:signal transduction histidine kinase/DNA-binding response OmpR family regulator/HPt (histidine-containing phosphotransfer) domain-containing protein